MQKELITDLFYKWMIEFVEVNNNNLNNWPPCPYAKQARINNQIKIIFSGIEKLHDNIENGLDWLSKYEVVVIFFDHNQLSPEGLQEFVVSINNNLLPMNYVILEDHPDTPEYINGIKMNFGECGLLILQKLDKLNSASDTLKEKGYYLPWSEKNLNDVVNWRYK